MDANAEADAQRRLAALVQTAESMQQDIHMQPDEVAAGAWTDSGRGLEGRKRGRQESDGESSLIHSRPKSSPVDNAEWIQKSMMEHYMMLQMLTMVSLLPCPLCFYECVCKRGRRASTGPDESAQTGTADARRGRGRQPASTRRLPRRRRDQQGGKGVASKRRAP